jgi:hypothetical protein
MIRRGKSPNSTDSMGTPAWILDMFPGYFDPCPYNEEWSETDYDGLNDEWCKVSPVIFVNPPYSNVTPWVNKALEHRFYMNMMHPMRSQKIIMLLKHDSSTKWYSSLHEAGARFLMIQGRLKFRIGDESKNHASFPSVLVVI